MHPVEDSNCRTNGETEYNGVPETPEPRTRAVRHAPTGLSRSDWGRKLKLIFLRKTQKNELSSLTRGHLILTT